MTSLPPQPKPDLDTDGFWRSLADGRLAVCRCQSCGLWLHPPLERCRRCGGPTAFEPASGRGSVYSYIVVHHPAVPGFTEQLPYVVGLVELDEQPGLRLPVRLVGVHPDQASVGSRVEAEIVDHPGGTYRVAVFRPVPDGRPRLDAGVASADRPSR